jgi:hypothetical protein
VEPHQQPQHHHAGNTVKVGLVKGREISPLSERARPHRIAESNALEAGAGKSRERGREKHERSAKAPRPGESIEHWKARVNYSSASASAASGGELHRSCYSWFTFMDSSSSNSGSWFCF